MLTVDELACLRVIYRCSYCEGAPASFASRPTRKTARTLDELGLVLVAEGKYRTEASITNAGLCYVRQQEREARGR